ncbi:NAD(P)-dependent dehydrogenase (short-subunit alcohol dehydrogenase family) [Variovorax sp. TBS-050B]|uniref:SDR family NAD(P)-dependent oxidoreductase n=1 Tax=Variovorax sp. TBS-050B TaxID=2940551 RepID=UPI0024738430|nr:SDR family NAD(P)-dependent oxidoreductase [Variovorax sp. TBS-050B]MDH6590750.1 NAD(P)-dependent dehydrogenase (short-subunit alcohol dehydrogenase family) [Variovorax sp. TBS-050B]
MNANPLAGRHALVTGAARGIGAEIARTLAAEGATLTLLGRDLDALQRLAATLAGQGHGAAVADVADEAAVRTAFAQAAKERGPVAILVNNAGAAESAPFLKTSAALWQRMLSVNLTGTFLCTQAALPGMLDAGWGRIVNIASTAGQKGYAYVAAYTAAKHGVIGLTRALALEVARKGVTVNAVCPGYTDTDILRTSVANVVGKTGRSEADALAEFSSVNPQKRIVQPAEVADAVRWLCGEGAGAVTGQSISVSGGEVM